MVRDTLFALPVCDIKPKARRRKTRGATASGLLGISQAIPTVVLKPAALANNSESDCPTFSCSDSGSLYL